MIQGQVVSVNSSDRESDSLEEKLVCASHQTFLRRVHSGPREITDDNVSVDVKNSSKYIKQFDISKTNRESIEIDIGGVVGDTHFHKPALIDGHWVRRTAEITLFKIEEYSRLNLMFNTSVSPGGLGENITTAGIDLDNLSQGTILTIGTAKIKIISRRSFCYKFINTFLPDKEYWTTADKKKFDLTKVGIVGQVLEPGIIKPGYQISANIPENFKILTHLPASKKFTKIKVDDLPNL